MALLYLESKPIYNEDCCLTLLISIYLTCPSILTLSLVESTLNVHFIDHCFSCYEEKSVFPSFYASCIIFYKLRWTWLWQKIQEMYTKCKYVLSLVGIFRLEFFRYVSVTSNKSSLSIPTFIITDGWPKLQAPLSAHHVCSSFQLSLVAFLKIPNFIPFLDTR